MKFEVTLNSQNINTKDYLYTNVKDMQLLSVTEINKVLEKKGETPLPNIESIKKIYVN